MFFSQRPLPDGINPAIDPFHQPQGPGQTDYLSEWPRDRTGAIKRDAYETISHLCSFAFAACLETVVGQVCECRSPQTGKHLLGCEWRRRYCRYCFTEDISVIFPCSRRNGIWSRDLCLPPHALSSDGILKAWQRRDAVCLPVHNAFPLMNFSSYYVAFFLLFLSTKFLIHSGMLLMTQTIAVSHIHISLQQLNKLHIYAL